MPKKYHKSYLHKEKHPKHVRKHKKDQNSLPPIQERSKEKVKIDQNACGDSLEKPDDVKKMKRAMNREQEKVRHHSLEKTTESLLNRTKMLFRKEKSFNDALQKVTEKNDDSNINNNSQIIAKKHKHRSRKHEQRIPDKNEKSPKRNQKSPQTEPKTCRIQEVIFCQMEQNQFKMKNDKNYSEIKDLYQRIKKENKRDKEQKPKTEEKITNKQQKEETKNHESECKKHHKNEKRTNHSKDLKPYKHKEQKNEEKESSKIEEQKIHKIVQGDLKNYFGQIQSMIDKKFEMFLQISKERREKRKKEKEERAKSGANKEKEEEIINKVLKRLKHEEKIEDIKAQTISTLQKSPERDKELQNKKSTNKSVSSFSEKRSRKSPEKDNDCEDVNKEKYIEPINNTQMSAKPRKSPERQDFTCQMTRRSKRYHHRLSNFAEKKEDLLVLNLLQESSTNCKHLMLSASEETAGVNKNHEKRRSSSPGRCLKELLLLPPENFRTPMRQLKCDTLSIINIPPKKPNETHTQTLSSAEKDFVERRKKSKRFKLYYKYSAADNSREDNLDVSSIVSDSYRNVSDPSEEILIVEAGTKLSKKWRLSTPKDSHLKNIIEEPLEGTEKEYFMPLRGTREYYSRAMSSSHSEYCFKIDKKPANSDISLQSKDTGDGSLYTYEDAKFRPLKVKKSYSRSNFKVISKINGYYVIHSKSDTCLYENNKEIKPQFLQKRKRKSNEKSAFRIFLDEQNLVKISKPCQTNIEINNEDKIKKICKKIEEQTTKNSQVKSIETAVSSGFLNQEGTIYENDENFAAIYKTIDNLQDKMTENFKKPAETVDAAIGALTPIETRSRSLKKMHRETGVGPSQMNFKRNPRKSAAVSPIINAPSKTKHLKSIALSPIRFPENTSTKSPASTRKTNKPIWTSKQLSPARTIPTNIENANSKTKPPFKSLNSYCSRQARPKTTAKPAMEIVKVFKEVEKTRNDSQCSRRTNKSEKEFKNLATGGENADKKKPKTCTPRSARKAQAEEVFQEKSNSSINNAIQKIRKSKSMVELKLSQRSNLNRSKSEICRKTLKNHNSMEKFRNVPNLRCLASQSEVESKATSRLFTTKDYNNKNGEVSSYEKRKQYDKIMRKKMMKKKIKFSKADLGKTTVGYMYVQNNNSDNSLFSLELKKLFNKYDQKDSNPITALNEVEECVNSCLNQINNNNNIPVSKLMQMCQKFPDINNILNDNNISCSCSEFSIKCAACRNSVEVLYCYLSKYRDNSDSSNNINKSLENISLKPKLSFAISCPVLSKRSSIFEYLYEPTSSSSSQNLRKTLQYNVTCDLDSGRGSAESGYSSTHFFKKPHIAALFKTPIEPLNISNKDGSVLLSDIESKLDINNDELNKKKVVEFSEANNKSCKLVFSNDCLNIETSSYLQSQIFTNSNYCDTTVTPKISNCSLSFLNNSDPNTKNFFMSLIKFYEIEQEICNRLFEDDLFEETLLKTAKEKLQRQKKKKGAFTRLFKKTQTANDYSKQVNIHHDEELIELQQKASTLASNAKKSFSMLAQAIKLNGTIDNQIKICGLLRLLERIETGDFHMTWNNENIDVEDQIRAQILEAFANVYDFCNKEAKKYKKHITSKEIKLIKSFVIKHRIGLLSEANIMASYISRGLIQTEEELKRAITFLIHSKSNESNIKDFENYFALLKQ